MPVSVSGAATDREVATVGRLVLAAPARVGRTRLVCIDGRAGAGKTTFAAGLARWLFDAGPNTATVHMDDLYAGWEGLPSVSGRVAQHVIPPLRRGATASLPRWDWNRGAWGSLLRFPACEVVVLEGAGSYSSSYAGFVSLLVWLEADPAVRRDRALARDGGVFAPHWQAWSASELSLLAREQTPMRADVVVRTDEPADRA